MLSIRSPLRIKYNPTIKYTVELSLHSKSELGQLKIMTRTQSQTLIELLDAFSTASRRSSSGISAGCSPR